MKSLFANAGFIVFYIVVLGTWINGCFHSFKKHKDDPRWLQESPLVIYRGVEYFWHDDFEGVNWDDKIKSDVSTMFLLFNLSSETTDIDNTKEQTVKFGEKIKKYPLDKILLLKKAAKQYILYNATMSNEMDKYIADVLEGKSPDPKYWGNESKKIADSLIKNYEVPSYSLAINVMDSFAVIIRFKAGFGENQEVKNYKQSLSVSSKVIHDDMRKAYKMIFNEPLK